MQHKANAQRLAGIWYYWCAKARPRDNTFGFGPMSIVDIRNDRHSHRRMKAAPKNRVPPLSVCPSNSAEAFELPELPRIHSIYFISGSDTCTAEAPQDRDLAKAVAIALLLFRTYSAYRELALFRISAVPLMILRSSNR
jgi:hypothetical protein